MKPRNSVPPADHTVSTDKLVDGAVTHAKISEGAIATDQVLDEAITIAKLAVHTVVDHLGYTPADVEQTWTRTNFDPDSKLGNTGDQVLQGPLMVDTWLGLKDAESNAVRGLIHSDDAVGFTNQDGQWNLRIEKDDAVWTRKYGYLHDAFTPRSAMTLNGIGSLRMWIQHDALEGKIVTSTRFPGSWLTLCDSGLQGLRLFVRIE